MNNENVRITNIKPLTGKNLLALFSIELPSGTIINSCLLRYSEENRTYTVVPPRIQLRDRTAAC